jgi:hypothetical protein
VVSRGPEHTIVTAPDLTGLSPQAALEALEKTGLGFSFALRPAGPNERAGAVVVQEPAGGTVIESSGKVDMLVARPAETGGEVFGLFSYTMPENPYPLPLRLEALPASGGERRLLAETNFHGGTFTFPYREVPGITLILTMLNRELYRETVQPPMDELSLDAL